MPKSWIKKITSVISEMFITLGGYVRVYAKIIIITFTELYLAFNIYRAFGFNIEYPFLLAVVIAIIDLLPILGVGTVLVPWAIWLAVMGEFGFAIAVGITYLFTFIVRQFMEPKLVSSQFGIHPLITLFAMYAGFKAAGVIGLILGPIGLMLLKNIFSRQIEKGLFKDIFDEK
jgi:predicted PurR-regulated permease PerM